VGAVRHSLLRVLRQLARQRRAEVRELEVLPDHVHLLVGINPQYGIHRLVKHLKGWSSHVLRGKYATLRSRLPTLWTNSYFVATVGGAMLAIVKQYIEQQRHA